MNKFPFYSIFFTFLSSYFFLFNAEAQLNQLKCAEKPSSSLSCNIKNEAAKDLSIDSKKIKEACDKAQISPEFRKAAENLGLSNYISIYGNMENNEELIQYDIKEMEKYLAALKKHLKNPGKELGQTKAQINLEKKLNNLSDQINKASENNDLDKANKLAQKYDALEKQYSENYNNYDFSNFSKDDLESSMTDIKSELAYLKSQLKEIKKTSQKKKVGKNKKEQEALEFEASVSSYLAQIKSRQTFTDCGMTDQEIIAISLYTGSAYTEINQALRSKNSEDLKKYKVIVDSINSGLEKLASHQDIVKRGANLPKSIEIQHCLGCVVTYTAYTSTSTQNGFSGKHAFLIKSKNGRYLAPLSLNASEEEVLFKSNSHFKVVNIDEKPGGQMIFTMEEVDK